MAPVALLALVLGLDLLWAVFVGSTGSVTYGLIDEPAHLATCALALLALTALRGAPPPPTFVAAALVGSVVIDVDHIPGYLGSHALTGTLPRPYAHSLATVAALLVAGSLARGSKLRWVLLGLGFGVATHLLRDLATGPGIGLFWPLSTSAASAPYASYAILLAVFAGLAVGSVARGRQVAAVATLGIAILAIATLSAAPARAASTVSLGAYIPGAAEDLGLIDRYGAEVGQMPTIVSIYNQWSRPALESSELRPIWARGAVPLVTWEPWTTLGAGFPLRLIAEGRYDAYVRKSARAAALWGKPVLLRFAHEMNGDWYPWGRTGKSSPHVYKAAWRHVVAIFRQCHADNVRWVWTPYVSQSRRLSFERYFPGDKWVDWVGLDGFNFHHHGQWKSFGEIFASSYRTLTRISSRPIMIAETGTVEAGARKAAWVRNSLERELPRLGGVRALVWFDDTFNGIDASVNSSPSALNALRWAADSPRYSSGRRAVLKASGFRP